LNIPYEVKVYLRDPIAAPQELKNVHPLGKVRPLQCFMIQKATTDGAVCVTESRDYGSRKSNRRKLDHHRYALFHSSQSPTKPSFPDRLRNPHLRPHSRHPRIQPRQQLLVRLQRGLVDAVPADDVGLECCGAAGAMDGEDCD
jgi:hypothetical protein